MSIARSSPVSRGILKGYQQTQGLVISEEINRFYVLIRFGLGNCTEASVAFFFEHRIVGLEFRKCATPVSDHSLKSIIQFHRNFRESLIACIGVNYRYSVLV